VAAFCACCGAEITVIAEACPVCGNPLHGMSISDLPLATDIDTDPSGEDISTGTGTRRIPNLSRAL
jgi:hypothetical protein